MKNQSRHISRTRRRMRGVNRTMRKLQKLQQQQQLQGGRRVITRPKIKYEHGNSQEHTLTCTKCQGGDFVVKTMTLGTKIKSLFGLGILDNRFKVFRCTGCGFVQMYSNHITCDGKQCDPLIKV